MKNNFALSFGLALAVVGIICMFVDVSNIIMFGVALSACYFSFVSMILGIKNSKKGELAYSIPFIILLVFCCFGDTLIKDSDVNEIVNSGIINSITFLSFGMIFLSEYINNKKSIVLEKEKYIRIVDENLNYAESILDMVEEYKQSLEKKNMVIDSESMVFIDRICELFTAKMQQCSISNKLLFKNKDEFNLDDVNEAFIDSTSILKEKDIDSVSVNKNNK